MKKEKNKIIIIILAVLLIASVITIAFLLGRESKHNYVYNEDYKTENHKKNTKEEPASTSTNSEKKDTSTVTNKTIKYSEKDTTVIEEIEKIEDATDTILEEKDQDGAKDKLKGVFISLVDFLFYDGEIKGVTFDELTKAGKEKVLKIVHSIDEKIEKRFPNYKENISTTASNAFKKASELIKKGAANISDFSREKLGEENYNRIIESKDELVKYTKAAYSIIKDVGGNFLSKTKDKIKNWYEKFRDE